MAALMKNCLTNVSLNISNKTLNKIFTQNTRSAPIEGKKITEIFVSDSQGYFISNDLKNALNLTQEYISEKLNAKMTVSKMSFFFVDVTEIPQHLLSQKN